MVQKVSDVQAWAVANKGMTESEALVWANQAVSYQREAEASAPAPSPSPSPSPAPAPVAQTASTTATSNNTTAYTPVTNSQGNTWDSYYQTQLSQGLTGQAAIDAASKSFNADNSVYTQHIPTSSDYQNYQVSTTTTGRLATNTDVAYQNLQKAGVDLTGLPEFKDVLKWHIENGTTNPEATAYRAYTQMMNDAAGKTAGTPGAITIDDTLALFAPEKPEFENYNTTFLTSSQRENMTNTYIDLINTGSVESLYQQSIAQTPEIANIWTPEAMEHLANLDHPDDEIRLAASRALQAMGITNSTKRPGGYISPAVVPGGWNPVTGEQFSGDWAPENNLWGVGLSDAQKSALKQVVPQSLLAEWTVTADDGTDTVLIDDGAGGGVIPGGTTGGGGGGTYQPGDAFGSPGGGGSGGSTTNPADPTADPNEDDTIPTFQPGPRSDLSTYLLFGPDGLRYTIQAPTPESAIDRAVAYHNSNTSGSDNRPLTTTDFSVNNSLPPVDSLGDQYGGAGRYVFTDHAGNTIEVDANSSIEALSKANALWELRYGAHDGVYTPPGLHITSGPTNNTTPPPTNNPPGSGSGNEWDSANLDGLRAYLQNLATNPELPPGTEQVYTALQAGLDEFMTQHNISNVDEIDAPTVQAALSHAYQAVAGEYDAALLEEALPGLEAHLGSISDQSLVTDPYKGELSDDAQLEYIWEELDRRATIQGQLAELLPGDSTDIPNWAQPAVDMANKLMADRGMGRSTVARDSLYNAVIGSALQIAQNDANAYKEAWLVNLDNELKVEMFNAANIANMDIQNASFAQQAQMYNAQAFLQLDFKNMDAENRAREIEYQARTNALLADVSAENAARQFNAQNASQISQFNAQMSTQVSLDNAARADAMSQFNAANSIDAQKFNSTLKFNRDQFNANMAMQIEQSNVNWRREINKINTAGENAVNQANAINRFNLSNQALTNLWQEARDNAYWAWMGNQNAEERATKMAMAALTNETMASQQDFAAVQTIGQFAFNILGLGN